MSRLFSYKVLIPIALVLAVMPPGNPHLLEKTRMLTDGRLVRPMDIFDLLWHAWPLALLGIKAGRDLGRRITVRPGSGEGSHV